MTPPRRRWFQFGLSTLLLVTLLASALVACQRKRLSRWVESFRPAPPAEQATPLSGPRDPRQVVTDFLEFKRQGKHAEADKLLLPKALEAMKRTGFLVVDEIAENSVRHDKLADGDIGGSVFVTTTCTYAKPVDGQLQIMWELRPNDWSDKTLDWRIGGITLPNSDGKAVRRWLLNLENEAGLRRWKGWSLRSALTTGGGGVILPSEE